MAGMVVSLWLGEGRTVEQPGIDCGSWVAERA